jgi:hypothetical protein
MPLKRRTWRRRNFDLNLQQRHAIAAIHFYLYAIGFRFDVLRYCGQDLVPKHDDEIGPAGGVSLVRQQNLKPLTGD